MSITPQNYRRASVEDWQTAFHDLFGHIDDKRDLDSIWRHAIVNASRVSSDIRKRNFGLAFEHLAHLTNWVMSTIQRCQNSEKLDHDGLFHTTKSISEIVWEKYPSICLYCKTKPCSCTAILNAKSKLTERPDVGEKSQNRPETLDDWCKMFDEIYGNIHAGISIEDLSLHLFEETGEVAHEITRLTEIINGSRTEEKRRDFFYEVADVFSWICSLVNKINHAYFEPAARHFEKVRGADGETIQTETLSQIIWSTYGSPRGLICPLCKSGPCECDKKLKF